MVYTDLFKIWGPATTDSNPLKSGGFRRKYTTDFYGFFLGLKICDVEVALNILFFTLIAQAYIIITCIFHVFIHFSSMQYLLMTCVFEHRIYRDILS